MVMTMERATDSSRAKFDRAVSEAAAGRVIDDVIIAMLDSGFNAEQAKGIGYATQEFLVGSSGYRERARKALVAAGFGASDASDLLDEISEISSRLAA